MTQKKSENLLFYDWKGNISIRVLKDSSTEWYQIIYELALDKHYNNNRFLYLVWAIVNVFVVGLDPNPIFGYACGGIKLWSKLGDHLKDRLRS